MLDSMAAVNVRLDGSQLLHLLDLGKLSLLFVGMPMFNPHKEAFIFIVHHTVDFPVEVRQPLQFQHIQFMHRDAAHFSPRTVLERIVVKELAA